MSTSEGFAFHVVVDALDAVAAAPGRKAKVALLADCLSATPDPLVPAVVGWLAGAPRQRRTGVGWAALRDLPEVVPALPGSTPLTASEVDDAFERWQAQAGAGSTAQRAADVAQLLSRATFAEAAVLRVLIAGGARTGAAAGLVLDAVVLACGAPADVVRRAAMLLGDPAQALLVARRDGEAGLRAVGLQLGVPLAPMLAASAASVGEALAKAGPAAVEWKLDGVRVQVHRDGDSVRLFTRTLDEITDRLPDVIAEVAALPVTRLVADGEVLAFRDGGRPEPFQVTSARVARRRRRPGAGVPAPSPSAWCSSTSCTSTAATSGRTTGPRAGTPWSRWSGPRHRTWPLPECTWCRAWRCRPRAPRRPSRSPRPRSPPDTRESS